MKNNKAYTIVEIIIVVTVIAILSSLAVVTFNSVRQDSRDATRQGSATIISEALEKYYERNGEYPSIPSIVKDNSANTGEAVASKLSIPANSLITPELPNSETNALTSNPNADGDYIAYVSQDTNSQCQSNVDGGCDEFTLQYIEEASGEIKEVESRHSSRIESVKPDLELSASGAATINAAWTDMANASSYELQRSSSSSLDSPITTTHSSVSTSVTGLTPATEYFFRVRAVFPTSFSEWSDVQSTSTGGLPTPTGTISISATMSGSNARGATSGGTCPTGTTMERQIRYRINTESWQAYTTGTPRDVAATEGSNYTFQAQARCKSGSTNGPWVTSTTATVMRPISAPSGLTMTAAMSGTSARGTAGGGSCATGTTTQRQIRYYVNSGSYVAWTTGTPRSVAATEGARYTFQQQARCVGVNASSAWATSPTDSVTRPVTAPSGLSVSATMNGVYARGTFGGGSCASGTSLQRQFRYQVNTNAWSSWATVGTAWETTATPGYRYTFQQQARCNGTHASSGWVASGTDYIVRGVSAPSGLAISATIVSTSYARGAASGGSCTSGSSIQRQIRYQINTGAWSAWSTRSTWDISATSGYRYTFQQQARCIGQYANSSWASSSTANTVRPVATPSAPALAISTSGSTTTWTATGSCPSGTTATYQRRSLQEGSSWTAWGYGTTSRTSTWNTSAQGYNYSRMYRVMCDGVYANSAWSGQSPTRSYLRPVSVAAVSSSSWTHVSLGWQHESNCMYYNGCKWRRFNWTPPACPSGTAYHSSTWNSYVGTKMSWDNGQPQAYRWWKGASQATTTNDAVSYASRVSSHIVEYRYNVPSNYDNVRHKVTYTCRNAATGRTGSSASYSPMFRYM